MNPAGGRAEKFLTMTNKLFILTLAAAAMLSGCKKYDDTDVRNDIKNLQERVTTLEAWCQTAQGQIGSLQTLVGALESKNCITGVTPVMEGDQEVGYTIAFQTGNPITIKHGNAGDPAVTPQFGAAKDASNPSDETYYWTVTTGEGEPAFLLDNQGRKMAVTGEKGEPGQQGGQGEPGQQGVQGEPGPKGDTPELSVGEDGGTLYWKVNGQWLLNGGHKVPATGEPGDAIFQQGGIDTQSDPDNVTFTLADGSKLTVPRANALTVGFESYELAYVGTSSEIALTLPASLHEDGYTALMAEVKNEAGSGTAIVTRAAAQPWQVTVTKPTFVDGVCQNDAKVKVTIPDSETAGSHAILKVTLLDNKGHEVTASRPLEFRGISVPSGDLGTTTFDPAKDYMIQGDGGTVTLTEVKEIKGQNVTISDVVFDSPKAVDVTAASVTLEGVTLSGSQPKANGNAMMSINNAETVTISDLTMGKTDGYNTIEIGLNSTSLPAKINIDNVKFTEAISNNAILIFGTQDNAEIHITNCYFKAVSNALRLSNKTNATGVQVTIKDCIVDQWENGAGMERWTGFLILEDYTRYDQQTGSGSTAGELAAQANRFGPDKMTVTFDNVTGPNGKIDFSADPSQGAPGAGVNDAANGYKNQTYYICWDYAGNTIQSWDENLYPRFIFR